MLCNYYTSAYIHDNNPQINLSFKLVKTLFISDL